MTPQPLHNGRQFGTATRSPRGTCPHFSAPSTVASHSSHLIPLSRELLSTWASYHPPDSPPTPPKPEGTTSGTNPEPGGHPHHHPASLRGGQSCIVNTQKRLAWDKTAVAKFFSRPPNSGSLARIYCQWLRYCCRYLFNLYNTSGANSPLQIPHWHRQPCASLRGGHHVPIPGAGSRGALYPPRGEAIYISTMVHSLGKTGSTMETVNGS